MDQSITSVDLDRPIPGTILRLAWPVLVAEALRSAFSLVDMAWVGRLGAEATAALSASLFLVWLSHSLGWMLVAGVQAMVSRFIGAGAPDRAAHTTGHAILLCVILGAIVGWTADIWAAWILHLVGLEPAVDTLARSYILLVLKASPVLYVLMVLEGTMRATGDTKTPMIVIGTSLLLNAVLDPILIFGLGSIHPMGIAGAAWATIFCQGLGVLVFIILRRKNHPNLPLSLKPFVHPRIGTVSLLLRIGAPMFFGGGLFSLVYLFLSAQAAKLGTPQVACLGIGVNIEAVTYILSFGFGIAAATLVGQNLGAKRPKRAEQSAWIATAMSIVPSIPIAVALIWFPEYLVRIFSDAPEVIVLAALYFPILGIAQPFQAMEVVLEQAFTGSGDTLTPTSVSVSASLMRIPLSFVSVTRTKWGLPGIGLVITATGITRMIIVAALFSTNRWKSKVSM